MCPTELVSGKDDCIGTWLGVACKVALEESFLAQHSTGILDLHRERRRCVSSCKVSNLVDRFSRTEAIVKRHGIGVTDLCKF